MQRHLQPWRLGPRHAHEVAVDEAQYRLVRHDQQGLVIRLELVDLNNGRWSGGKGSDGHVSQEGGKRSIYTSLSSSKKRREERDRRLRVRVSGASGKRSRGRLKTSHTAARPRPCEEPHNRWSVKQRKEADVAGGGGMGSGAGEARLPIEKAAFYKKATSRPGLTSGSSRESKSKYDSPRG
jgi:hypothetical protein